MYDRYVELKKKKGVKDAEVSRATGISKSTLSDWKAGRATPKADKLEKIARFFGVSLEYLMGTAAEEPEDHEGLKPYYIDPETARIAQELKDSPGRRTLMDASRGMTPDQINAIVNMIETMHGKDDYDEPC